MLVETTGQDEVQLEKSQELARLAATKCVLMAGGNWVEIKLLNQD